MISSANIDTHSHDFPNILPLPRKECRVVNHLGLRSLNLETPHKPKHTLYPNLATQHILPATQNHQIIFLRIRENALDHHIVEIELGIRDKDVKRIDEGGLNACFVRGGGGDVDKNCYS